MEYQSNNNDELSSSTASVNQPFEEPLHSSKERNQQTNNNNDTEPLQSNQPTTNIEISSFITSVHPLYGETLHSNEEWSKELKEKYTVNLQRKASTHGAKNFKFIHATNTSKKQPTVKNAVKKIQGENIWKQLKKDCSKCKNDLESFHNIQEKMEEEIRKKDFLKGCCPKEVVEYLTNTAANWDRNSCPNTANQRLFELLGIPTRLPTPTTNIAEQIKHVKAADRQLNVQYDPRCEGFRPTSFQVQIMDAIDARTNIIIRSPSSSGKTMMTLYLASKTTKIGKIAVYLGPNKPVCNEFMLYAYNANIPFAVGTEDYFNWNDLQTIMNKGGILICTPPILLKILLFPMTSEFKATNIESIIFDETPNLLKKHTEMPLLLLIATSLNWHSVMLSASFPTDTMEVLKKLCKATILQPSESIRPTDLVLLHFDEKKLKDLPTSKVFSNTLLTLPKDRLATALRMPITLKEFKETFQQSSTLPSHGQSVSKSFENTRVFRAIDMTKFALEYASNLPDQDSQCEKYFPTNRTPSSQEILDLLKILAKDGRLPALLFHSNKDLLNQYHQEITELLPEETHYVPKESSDPELHEQTGEKTPLAWLGKVTDEDLENVFPGRMTVKNGIKSFETRNRRARRALESPFFQGVSRGLGIHHHGVEPPVRDLVESCLRFGSIRAVLCDATLALGLNMPIKTVVFIGGDDETIDPEDFVQASGRAGRWGRDSQGSVLFYGCPWNHVKRMWDPFSAPEEKFPITCTQVLQLCAGSNEIKKLLPTWWNYEIPIWSWSSAEATITQHFLLLRKMGLIDTQYRLTKAGEIALHLSEDEEKEEVCILAGYAFSKFGAEIRKSISTSKDFLYLCSHLVKKWRAVQKSSHPTLQDSHASPAMVDLVTTIQKTAQQDFPFFQGKIIPTNAITSLYISFPNFPSDLYDSRSLVAHFIEKMAKFQKIANLPFGNDALNHLNESLWK